MTLLLGGARYHYLAVFHSYRDVAVYSLGQGAFRAFHRYGVLVVDRYLHTGGQANRQFTNAGHIDTRA
jgi:hypothetical protein